MKLEELRINIENRITALGYDVADSTIPMLTGFNDTVRVYVGVEAGERVLQGYNSYDDMPSSVEANVMIGISVIGTGQKRFDDVPVVAQAILSDLGLRQNYLQVGLDTFHALKWEMGIGEGTPIQRIHHTQYIGTYITTSNQF